RPDQRLACEEPPHRLDHRPAAGLLDRRSLEGMARLIRMDKTGHTTLAEWTPTDPASVESAVAALREGLAHGDYAVVTHGEGRAEQVTSLPVDADLVILRRPIAGG